MRQRSLRLYGKLREVATSSIEQGQHDQTRAKILSRARICVSLITRKSLRELCLACRVYYYVYVIGSLGTIKAWLDEQPEISSLRDQTLAKIRRQVSANKGLQGGL
eukprot:1157354-Pelagomonas_calceolata.AAC.4